MKKHNTAFVVEMLLLFVILLFVVVTVTRVFVASRKQSLDAKHLTEAVCLAENVAESAASAENTGEIADIFRGLDGVTAVEENADGIDLSMKLSADASDTYRAHFTADEEPGSAGTYVAGTIEIYYENETEPVYTLTTGTYRRNTP